jgi:hypothetical protein
VAPIGGQLGGNASATYARVSGGAGFAGGTCIPVAAGGPVMTGPYEGPFVPAAGFTRFYPWPMRPATPSRGGRVWATAATSQRSA